MAKIELYFFKLNGSTRACNMPPVVDMEGMGEDTKAISVVMCDAGLKVFGLKPLKKDQVVRMRISIESVETCIAEINLEYKPIAAARKSTKARN